METKEYKECETQINTYKDHSKLRKLYEILICFFTVGKTREQSKVIIFTQFRESAKEIKEYIDRQQDINEKIDVIKSEVFLGTSG